MPGNESPKLAMSGQARRCGNDVRLYMEMWASLQRPSGHPHCGAAGRSQGRESSEGGLWPAALLWVAGLILRLTVLAPGPD